MTSRPVELTAAEADFVEKMIGAIQLQGRENILLAAGLLLKIEPASGPPLPLDSVERKIAAAEAKES